MSPVSNSVPNVNLKLIITPAVSPIYMNNPGFAHLEIDPATAVVGQPVKYSVNNLWFTYLDLSYYNVF